MNERERFEKWAESEGLSLSILRNQFYEGYGDNATKRAWEAWQAALSPAPPTPDVQEQMDGAVRALYGPASEVSEPFDIGPTGELTLAEWVDERLKNCLRISASKEGDDKASWLEDASYFKRILDVLGGVSPAGTGQPDGAPEELAREIAAMCHATCYIWSGCRAETMSGQEQVNTLTEKVAALLRSRMERAERPEWVKVGQWVTWQGQVGPCTERILRITEPQPGNYVLWTTVDGQEMFGAVPANWPINFRQVTPSSCPTCKGTGMGIEGEPGGCENCGRPLPSAPDTEKKA